MLFRLLCPAFSFAYVDTWGAIQVLRNTVGVGGQGLTLAMCPLARMHFLGGRASSGHNNWFSTGPPGQWIFFF